MLDNSETTALDRARESGCFTCEMILAEELSKLGDDDGESYELD